MDLEYPAIKLFKNDQRIYAYADSRSFHRASPELIGLYSGARFIDAGGNEHRIRAARRVGWGTWLWGYHPLLKGRIARVDFAVDGTRRIDLVEFKRIVLDRLDPGAARPGWYPAPAERLRPWVQKAESFAQLMALFIHDAPEER